MNHTETLAKAFCDVVTRSLSSDELLQVIEWNRAEKDPLVCHTHDYCDANMLMDEAFTEAFGCSPLDDGQRDPKDDGMTLANVTLWNAAWNLAKGANFKSEEVVS